MPAFRSLTVVLMLAALTAGGARGIVRPGGAGPSSALASGPHVTVIVGPPSCCGSNGDCCCIASADVLQEANADASGAEPACCEHAESRHEPFHAQNDGNPRSATGTGCSAESPLCQCTAEQRVPLESFPAGLPAPQSDGDFCDAASAENRLASSELTFGNRSSSAPRAAAPLPLPILVQLATLCCWRA